MFEFFKAFSRKGRKFDRKVLRKNDISLLILDERWNKLFTNMEKPADILKHEDDLKGLLKEQARLTAEAKENAACKKNCMSRIMSLTTEAFDKDNEAAKTEMKQCEKEIKRINQRALEIEKELDLIPDRIKDANLDLLEITVNAVYFKIRGNQKRVAELEKLIEETHNKLKGYIDEKGLLSEDYTDMYTYFHDLLGAEELEKLDKEHFG